MIDGNNATIESAPICCHKIQALNVPKTPRKAKTMSIQTFNALLEVKTILYKNY